MSYKALIGIAHRVTLPPREPLSALRLAPPKVQGHPISLPYNRTARSEREAQARACAGERRRCVGRAVFSFSRDFPGILIVLITENEWDGKVVFVGF